MTYEKKHVTFLLKLKSSGLKTQEITKKFNEKFHQSRTEKQLRRVIDNALDNKPDKRAIKEESSKKELELENKAAIKKYVDFIKTNKYVPILSELVKAGIPSYIVKKNFQTVENLEAKARAAFPEIFALIIDEHSFTDPMFDELNKLVKKYDRFVITSAVTGCQVFEQGLSAIESYCEKNKALLLILPCSDPAASTGMKNNWSLDHKLPKESIVFRDINLNKNIFISTIKTSAKQINPLTGLSRIGQREGSFIYAAPKQFLEYVANSNDKKIPRALMTTGAITKPNYHTERYMSERTAYIANHDHLMGGIIVEVENDRLFHFRQFQIEPKTGAFIDLGVKYFKDGTTKKERAELVELGDYHSGSTDPITKQMGKEICDLVNPKKLYVQDFHDGLSISHHIDHKLITKAKLSEKSLDSLELELKQNQKDVNELLTWKIDELIFKYGNHEDFIKRWLEDGRYITQPKNHRVGVKLADAMFDGWMPFEFAMRKLYPVNGQDKIRFLTINDSLIVNGIETAVHGHMGANGSRNPGLEGIEKCYGAANTGHSHTAGILRNVWRVGTCSHLNLDYNDGPSSWTQTHLIQYANGSRQLINNVNGKWKK